MTSEPWVLVLSGSSSSGKTSLAHALLGLLDEPAVLLEADRAHPVHRRWPDDLLPPIQVFHRSVATWLVAGANVLLDGSLPYGDPALRDLCLRELPAGRTWVLGTECSVEELRRRESLRPDVRQPGWAERQARDVNDGLALMARIDTTAGRPEDHARQALRALRRAQHRTG